MAPKINLGLAPLQKCVGDFVVFAGDFPGGGIFWALFPPLKRGEKKRRQNPRKNLAAQK